MDMGVRSSQIIRLRLLDAEKGGDYGCRLSSDPTVNSSLKELQDSYYYIVFRSFRYSYASIPVLSLIFPSASICREISESELSELGSATGISESDLCKLGLEEISIESVDQFYFGSELYPCTKGTLTTVMCKSDYIYQFSRCMTYGVCGKNIYMMGSDRKYEDDWPANTPRVLQFEIKPPLISAKADDSYKIRRMNSDKGLYSFALNHNDILYVMAEYLCGQPPDPSHIFESYDIKKDKWEILSPPPGHYSTDHATSEIYSYALMEDKIYISTWNGAYVYHIKTDTWDICYLFDGGLKRFHPTHPPSYMGSSDEYDDKIKLGGSPFDFDGEGILFENEFLICALRSLALVVAYKIDSGKVVKKQVLCHFPEHYRNLNYMCHDSLIKLVALGKGYFCASYIELPSEDSKPLVLVVFHISRLVGSSDGRLLYSRICCRHEIQLDASDFGISPLCFVG